MDDYENLERYDNMMNFFDKWEKEREENNRKATEFIEHVSTELIQVAVKYFPETEEHKSKFYQPLKDRLFVMASEFLDSSDSILYPANEKEDTFPNYYIPERDQTEIERIYRENILKTMPKEQHAYFIKLEDERIKIASFDSEFIFQSHDKIKEILLIHYPEIVDYSANNLRFINYYSYMFAKEYLDEFYYYAGNFIIDRFP